MSVNDQLVALQLWDTAGQERFRSITRHYFRKADGVIVMYDVTSEQSFVNVRNWMSSVEVSSLCFIHNKVPILVVTYMAQWLDRNSTVTVDMFQQHRDYVTSLTPPPTPCTCVVIVLPTVVKGDHTITIQWRCSHYATKVIKKFSVYAFSTLKSSMVQPAGSLWTPCTHIRVELNSTLLEARAKTSRTSWQLSKIHGCEHVA